MKGKWRILCAVFLCCWLCAIPVQAVGDGNVDGGGGSMGQGSSQNVWSPGNDGVRVTVVRAEGREPVTRPVDLTNKKPKIDYSFGKVCKLSYSKGAALSVNTEAYEYVNPAQALPKIISSKSLGAANIEAIKSYFTDEQVIRGIAGMTGMSFDALIGGEYRLLLEPIGYYRFQGSMIASTATEAALYDEKLSGGLRKRMVSFTHKNLPLSMFLETGDLGYPAWGQSTDRTVSDEEIKSSLGLGVVRFQDAMPEEPETGGYDYEYRTNTEVITSVRIKGGQSDPDHPVSVTFQIGGHDYRVENVYYPEGEEQLAWVRWTTPMEEQVMEIPVTVEGGGVAEKEVITAKITDLGKNPPPDPNADDKNDSFQPAQVPYQSEVTTAGWSVWKPWWKAEWVWHETPEAEEEGYWVDEGWWEFLLEHHSASLSASMELEADEKSPTASGKTMKSGYGFHERVTTSVQTDQPDAVTPAQNAVTYFPEFGYETFWRLLERIGDGHGMSHEFFENSYSTYRGRTHFTPIWYPDGSYTPYTWLMDCWTPAGMLARNLTDTLQIQGNLWEDWHIAPQNPGR